MGLFGKRRDEPASPAPVAAPAPSVTPADLEKCSMLLLELEAAMDLDNGGRGNAAAYALALAGGYPSLTDRALFIKRMNTDLDAGKPGARIVDRRPWQWLAAVAAAACEGDSAGKLLAARLGLASWMWREHWQLQVPRLAPGRSVSGGDDWPGNWPVDLDIQFSEEVGLFPPPDDSFAVIVSSGIKALGTLDDAVQVVREKAGDEEPWSVTLVLRLLSRTLADMHQGGAGIEFDPFACAIAYSSLGEAR